MTIRTQVVMADVFYAEQALTKNIEPAVGVTGANRKSSMVKIMEYKEAMLAGEWMLSGAPIIFSDKDNLIDGAQRLKALKLANQERPGIVVPFLVVHGVPHDAMSVIDIGRRRTIGDFLTMDGERYANPTAKALRLIHCYDNLSYSNNAWTKARFSPQMLKTTLEANPSVRQAMIIARDAREQITLSASAAGWVLAQRIHGPWLPTQFIHGLGTGRNMDECDARYMLRESTRKWRASYRKWTTDQQLALWIKGFNAWVVGDDSHKPGFRAYERFPRIVGKESAVIFEPEDVPQSAS